jgi:hypothetical protein
MQKKIMLSALATFLVISAGLLPAMMAQGQTAPALRTPDVIYVPTPQNVVEAMLKMANVKQGDIVFDLGSGDGRIPITAVQMFGAAFATGGGVAGMGLWD